MISSILYLTYRWDPTGTTTLGPKGPGCNSNEGVLHILLSSKMESNHQFNVTPRTLWWGFYPSQEDRVSIF